jgi:hypothetical protein
MAAAVAAVAAGVLPAGTAHAALGPCRVAPTEIGLTTQPGRQLVAIAGVYTAPAGATSAELTCGAVVNGITYATVADEVPGPLAALAGAGWTPFGDVRSCYVLRVRYLDRSSTFTDTCP